MTNEFAIAVHALIYLHHCSGTVASEVLAENVCTNPVCIRKVMGKLKKAGIVTTKEGLNGGYHLLSDPTQLSLANVSEALKMEMVRSSWHSGSADKECMIASGMAGILDELVTGMNAACQEYLKTLTVADIETKIFKNK